MYLVELNTRYNGDIMTYTDAFNTAINHAMLYEVGSYWDLDSEGAKDGTNARNCGHTNDSNDPGGETKYGISKNENPDIDIAQLNWEGAEAIYYDRYWIAGQCDKLPDRIAVLHFDGCVNNGVRESAIFLQRAIGAEADGDIGPATLAAVATFDPIVVCGAICDQRSTFYHNIVSRTPSQGEYLNGWLRRVSEMRTFSTDPTGTF